MWFNPNHTFNSKTKLIVATSFAIEIVICYAAQGKKLPRSVKGWGEITPQEYSGMEIRVAVEKLERRG